LVGADFQASLCTPRRQVDFDGEGVGQRQRNLDSRCRGAARRLAAAEFSFRVDGLLQDPSEDGGGGIAALSRLGLRRRLGGGPGLDGAP